MAQKRRKDLPPAVTRTPKRLKKNKASLPKAATPPPALPEHQDIVLGDSDTGSDQDSELDVACNSDTGNDVVIDVASGSDSESEDEKPNEPKEEDSLRGNTDFIGFNFSSSGESDNDGGSDDGLLSDDGSGQKHMLGTAALSFPWVKGQDHLRQKEIADWLTLEIKDFVQYILPSKEEIENRNAVIAGLKENIKRFWPNTQTHVFGLCATDLYLPGSDIDMVVVSTTGEYEQRQRLYQLSLFLRHERLAKNIEVIALAKVPIIKFVDPKHGLHVDVSFERKNGIEAARRIRRWLDLTPGLRELVLIVKQFLRSRRLNNVHVGGLGGYATIIMVYHFLRLHPRVATGNILPQENLGTLLIEFFELYGRNFSYDNLILGLAPGTDAPRYLKKRHHPPLTSGRGLFLLIIQDPGDPNNNITRASYNLRDIKKAFGGAYSLLSQKCYDLNAAPYKKRLGSLILGDIIKYKGKDRDFNDDRDLVVNSALVQSDPESDLDNNKYYFSDMTALGDEYVPPEPRPASVPAPGNKHKKHTHETPKKSTHETPKKNTHETLKKNGAALPAKPAANLVDLPATKPAKKRTVEEFLGLDDQDEQDDTPRKNLLDKDTRRDYWSLKGLQT